MYYINETSWNNELQTSYFVLKYRNLLEYPAEQVRSPSTHVPQVTHCEQLHRKRQIKKTTYMSSVRRNTAPHNLIIEKEKRRVPCKNIYLKGHRHDSR